MNIEDEKEPTETQTDAIEAGVAEISDELFGQANDEEIKENDSSAGEQTKTSDQGVEPPPVDASEAAPQTPTGEENSEAVQEVGAPKTWTKEALEDWAKIPPRAQQEILKREEDFHNGIQQYKEFSDLGHAYDAEVAPYKAILAAENVDPVGLFRAFAGNHYILSRGTPEQKVALAASLLDGYKIPLVDLLNYFAENGGVKAPPSAETTALQERFSALESRLNEAQTRENDRVIATLRSEIDKMADDKEGHPYFDEVAEDITRLFETKQASNLQDAYDKAVYLNPTTRQKEIDRLTAEKTSSSARAQDERKTKVAKSTADQVKTKATARDGTVPAGSMDDTLEETLSEIKSR